MSRRDDAFWQDTLDRLDLDTGGLAEAERRLARETDEAAPLDPAWIDKVVAQATAPPTRVLTMPRPRVWTKLAAGLLGAMLLTAATWFVVRTWKGTHSTWTLPLTETMQLLDDHDAEQGQRYLAVLKAAENVRYAISELTALRDDSSAGPLARAAASYLSELAAALASKLSTRARVEADLPLAFRDAADQSRSVEDRLEALNAAGRSAIALARALSRMQSLPPREDEDRRELVERLRRDLDR